MLQKAPKPVRKPTNVTIDAALVEEAKALGLNMSQLAEDALAKAVSEEKSRRWKIENQAALDAWNDYVDKNGLPLAKYRLF
ncbi:type II toxin-antitoxin system CcdA family antitoxin [Aminobacter carboxidus]|uniref:Type II toxin-antitoxin system CcdA family antitoxin n=1 Tax=Aminobacter carboxidus TaxID=376165 RepID=A0ABR9GM59_9HYPH|nr:type II toxin-antitoxin system CcdA family antitoxin [Aminobacter carboxidus]MBE1204759.1 type II toxin-antitoxin system CcdA family antitoxin [Aminobacter carboxidus]